MMTKEKDIRHFGKFRSDLKNNIDNHKKHQKEERQRGKEIQKQKMEHEVKDRKAKYVDKQKQDFLNKHRS
jgi:hypothetical protein